MDHDERDWEDDDFDEEIDGESSDDDEELTIACPYCKRQIHEDAERCPYCEQYISDEDAPPQRKPWLIVVGSVVCLYIVYRWIVGG